MTTVPGADTYLAECLWPDVTREQVQDAARRAQQAVADAAEAGSAIRYLGSILVPHDDVVFFQFESGSAGEVERVCRAADVSFERIVTSEHVSAT